MLPLFYYINSSAWNWNIVGLCWSNGSRILILKQKLVRMNGLQNVTIIVVVNRDFSMYDLEGICAA